MKRLIVLNSLFAAMVLPMVAAAQGISKGDAGGFGIFVQGLSDLVNNFLIPFLIALTVLAFIWGVFQYFIAGGADEDKRSQGKQLMLYALIGFVAIVALWGIVNFLVTALGFDSQTDVIDNIPTGPTI